MSVRLPAAVIVIGVMAIVTQAAVGSVRPARMLAALASMGVPPTASKHCMDQQ